MEQLDIFDEEFHPLYPTTATIDAVHQHGLWHQTFACWLVNPQTKKIFLQQRGPRNRIGPNTFDASASGHLSAGEKPIEGFRELTEELGNNLTLSDKTFLGIHRNIVIKGNYINREFCHIYIAKTTNNLSDFILQAGEVSGIFTLDIADGIKLFSDNKNQVTIDGIIWDGTRYKPEKRKITTTDFCAYHDRVCISGYYLKVMIMAERYINNCPPYRI